MSSISPGLSQPFVQYAHDNHGAAVTIAALVAAVAMLTFVVTRLILSVTLKRDRGVEHYLSVISTVISILQTYTIVAAVHYGLGKHQSALSQEKFSQYSKFQYASQFLLVIALAMSKLSMVVFLRGLTQRKRVIVACNVLLAAIIGWTVFSLFATAFQCDLPDAWVYAPQRCAGQGALQYPIAIGNILTDIALAGTPLPVTLGLQMPVRKRAAISGLLGCRILVPAVAIVQLCLLPAHLQSADTTWTIVRPQICAQVMMNLSIVVTTMPFLHRVLAGLHTGILDTTLITEQLELSRYGRSYITDPKSVGDPSSTGSEQSQKKDRGNSVRVASMALRPSPAAEVHSTAAHEPHSRGMGRNRSVMERDPETESMQNLTRHEDGIMQTWEVKVESESRPPSR